ncbi:MAG: TlyA family rRNA (cytidine-2'-O)-methyltransferase [Chloroflexi bacterium HGW-Chloroflexi-6]|nr:MAG: TlyA family rRNA (cytidine-2'-O)-methyltransferase [Chloroflexi bacterium HGW-Chloroflexi-6]
MLKIRLDLLLMERGLAESRAKAQAIIMAGQVRVNGQLVDKASASFLPDVQVDVDSGPRFVSRGGEKLLGALETFAVDPGGLFCVDVGASTGGFSDCLLQHGAAKIYTIDVGKGILHWKIRSDPRVIVMEETNARFVESLPEPVQLVVCDASFISLKTLLPVMKKWLTPEKSLRPLSQKMGDAEGELITLIKPQFEAGRKESAKHKGVIRDPEIHARILLDILQFALDNGYGVRGLAKSSLLGPKGNVEFLAWLDLNQATSVEIPTLVAQVLGSPQPEKAE